MQNMYTRLQSTSEFDPQSIYFFQQMAVLDYFLGNLDGHGGNCLVKNGKGGHLIEDLRKIDNANTFITHNPLSQKWIPDSKQYEWHSLEIAKEPFSAEVKEIMQKIVPEEINSAIEKINIAAPGFLNDNMIDLLMQRGEVLYAASQIQHYTPNELGSLRTHDQIIQFFHKNKCHKWKISDETHASRTGDFNLIDDYEPRPTSHDEASGQEEL